MKSHHTLEPATTWQPNTEVKLRAQRRVKGNTAYDLLKSVACNSTCHVTIYSLRTACSTSPPVSPLQMLAFNANTMENVANATYLSYRKGSRQPVNQQKNIVTPLYNFLCL